MYTSASIMEQGEMQASLWVTARANPKVICVLQTFQSPRHNLAAPSPRRQWGGLVNRQLEMSQPCQLCGSSPELQQDKGQGMQDRAENPGSCPQAQPAPNWAALPAARHTTRAWPPTAGPGFRPGCPGSGRFSQYRLLVTRAPPHPRKSDQPEAGPGCVRKPLCPLALSPAPSSSSALIRPQHKARASPGDSSESQVRPELPVLTWDMKEQVLLLTEIHETHISSGVCG